MQFRHEYKHEINYQDMLVLRNRLSAVMNRDKHTVDGKYFLRSLYFDTPDDKALREKINGVNKREKFRIRYYNDDLSFIKLEKKSKLNGLCAKQATAITKDEAVRLTNGDIAWMKSDKRPLVSELYVKMRNTGLRPKTVVDYTREPYVFSAGNVRVTLDYNIRTSLLQSGFFDKPSVTLPAGDAPIILEVKWDEFLPDIIRDAVNLTGRRSTAFSKYAQCRIYG